MIALRASLGAVALLLLATPATAQVKVKVSGVIAAPIHQTLHLPGTIVSPQSSALTTRVEGHVEALLVEAGDRVEPGQPLLRLDGTLALLEQERLQHSLEEAEHVHRDSLRLAKEAETLAGTQSVSQSKYRSQAAQAAINGARVEQLKSAVAIQREQVRRHTLTAPFAGVVTGRSTERGQWVGANTAVLRLERIDRLRIDAHVPERYFGRIAAGRPVTVLAGANDAAIGTVIERIVPSGDPVSRTFPVQIALPNPAESLTPGMSARVVFILDQDRSESVKQVPADAVERKADGGARVWVVRRTGTTAAAHPVEVKAGRQARDWVEVASPDLRADDLVVVRGNEGLSPGQPVIPDPLLPGGVG